ncbi:MAG: CaiB/BaiF CoA-transferase family protein [Actinomycetota bacterium]|nr:CaiB/BaiF CoA-transferase family protein [Actinomycetota bacterium]MDG2121689.1 CaiB/BaiF CoA-transferase family protein [Actinomycetota bacterium]
MGPLTGIRVVELAGIGPGPFCAMLLADLGAEVIRVDRSSQVDIGIDHGRKYSVLNRSRKSISVDLKNPDGIETVLKLVENADALIEGFRPGVTERLGLGPDECMERNPALVYGRMTGWGQEGPMAHAAGHDINYISLTGALHAIGGADKPSPPLNVVGDFGGGGVFLAFGLCAALLESKTSGLGQVVDSAMTEGAATLMSSIYGMYASGRWSNKREDNFLDGGSYYYGVYETADSKFISIGSIEGKFHDELLEITGLTDATTVDRNDQSTWEEKKQRMAQLVRLKTRDEWDELMLGTDVCYAPVLDFEEAPKHPHNVARQSFVEVEGVMQPAPTPKFSRTPGTVQMPPPAPGQHTSEILSDWGFNANEIEILKNIGAVS